MHSSQIATLSPSQFATLGKRMHRAVQTSWIAGVAIRTQVADVDALRAQIVDGLRTGTMAAHFDRTRNEVEVQDDTHVWVLPVY